MLTVDDAVRRILADVPRTPSETVDLADAHGRVLAGDVRALHDVPPWDNSAMDGYAVRAADLTGDEVALRLLEVVAAGRAPALRVEPGTASAVMTGAPIPEGADQVVMLEDSDGSREGAVRLRGAARPGQHVRRAGDDVRGGAVVLTRGQRLTPARIGLAAAVGHPTLPVAVRPRVGILSTGDEVVPPGRPLGPGQIHSSNNATLVGLVREAGAVPVDAGNAADTPEAITAALGALADRVDVVLTTGGVSVGAFDFVKDVYAALGADLDFWKVAMKPGKPLAFGRLRRGAREVTLFGLPGNPVSAVVNFYQFVRPFLRMQMGAERPFLPVIDAIAAEDVRESPGRAKLVRVSLERRGATVLFRSAGSQSSGVLASLAAAHGLLCIPPDQGAVRAGEPGRVQVLDASFLDGDAPDYGW